MADESEDIEASTASSAFTSTPAPQLLNVGPKDIYFPPPYAREVSAVITLTNITSEPVTFKIKTTAPKRYVVRPPLGICPPNQTIEINVTLNSHKEPLTNPEKGDKFQVQAFTIKSPPDAATQDVLKDIWKGKPSVTKSKISAHFCEAPKTEEPAVVNQVPVAEEPVVKVAEPVATIVNQSHAPKPRAVVDSAHTNSSKSFDNMVDPVSTPAPTASSQSLLIPLAIVFLLGLLLGFFLGMQFGGSSPQPDVVVAVVPDTVAAAAAASAAAAAQ